MFATTYSSRFPECLISRLYSVHFQLWVRSVLFSIDYPFESTKDAVEFIESAPLSPIDREKICHLNAERLFDLSAERAITPAETASAGADAR
jgi:predicted TIM-barrel fold metal-dependent hydrolase